MSAAIQQLRRGYRANESVDRPLTQTEKAAMISAAAATIAELFETLRVDHRNDHNTRDTPRRVAKMFVEEVFHGRYAEPPAITEFDNAEAFDGLIVTGPIEVRSTCAHHMMPIFGQAYIGVVPAHDGKIIGLSKYDRIVEYFASRLQIQEELVKQIGQFIVDRTHPAGLAVRISAVHMCKTHRGVRSSRDSRMVTNAYFGTMSTCAELKSDFLRECVALGH